MTEDEIKKNVDYESLTKHLKGEDPIYFAKNAMGCARDMHETIMDSLEKLIKGIAATNSEKASGFFVIFMAEMLLSNFRHFYANMSYALGPKGALELMYDHLDKVKKVIEDMYQEEILKEENKK